MRKYKPKLPKPKAPKRPYGLTAIHCADGRTLRQCVDEAATRKLAELEAQSAIADPPGPNQPLWTYQPGMEGVELHSEECGTYGMRAPMDGDTEEYKENFRLFLAESARVYELEEKERREFYEAGNRKWGSMFRSGREYAPFVSRMTRWVVEGLLPEGHLAILGATSKAGKSTFATALAMAVANGEPFLGMKTAHSAVLWCAYEESERERMEILSRWPSHPEHFYITHEKPMIDDWFSIEGLRFWIQKTGAKLLIIDPLYAATAVENLGDGRMALKALSSLKELCRTERIVVVVLHHITKETGIGLVRERFADSNQILATASMDMLMDATDLRDGGRLIKIACRGRGDFANRTLYIRSAGVTHFELIENPQGLTASHLEANWRIVDCIAPDGDGRTALEVARVLNLNLQSVRNRITDFLREGRVVAEGKLNRECVYTARPAASP